MALANVASKDGFSANSIDPTSIIPGGPADSRGVMPFGQGQSGQNSIPGGQVNPENYKLCLRHYARKFSDRCAESHM